MKPRKRIPPKRSKPRVIHSERTGSHKRVRLYGAAKSARRAEIFERAGGRCEESKELLIPEFLLVGMIPRLRCNRPATEWSHLRHGANKCDCLECGIASCSECHRRRHSGGKPVPRKPLAEAK